MSGGAEGSKAAGPGCPAVTESREAYASAGSAASADGPGSSEARPRCWPRGPARPSAGGRSGGTRAPRTASGSAPACGIDQLELVARRTHQRRPRPWGSRRASRCPGGGAQGAVGLDRDLEACGMQRLEQRASSWSSGSPPVQTTKRRPGSRRRPGGRHRGRQRLGRWRTAAARPVGAHEIGVAELADGVVRGPPRGRSTGCSPAKRQNTAGRPVLAPFALEGVEDLLDGVGHS